MHPTTFASLYGWSSKLCLDEGPLHQRFCELKYCRMFLPVFESNALCHPEDDIVKATSNLRKSFCFLFHQFDWNFDHQLMHLRNRFIQRRLEPLNPNDSRSMLLLWFTSCKIIYLQSSKLRFLWKSRRETIQEEELLSPLKCMWEFFDNEHFPCAAPLSPINEAPTSTWCFLQ